MHHDLYGYALGRCPGSVVPDTSDEFARCAVCDMYGSCDNVRVVCFSDMPDSGVVGRVWRVCDSCQYAAVYGCDCGVCGYCRSTELARLRFQAGEGIKVN